jgi:hypothetical protein
MRPPCAHQRQHAWRASTAQARWPAANHTAVCARSCRRQALPSDPDTQRHAWSCTTHTHTCTPAWHTRRQWRRTSRSASRAARPARPCGCRGRTPSRLRACVRRRGSGWVRDGCRTGTVEGGRGQDVGHAETRSGVRHMQNVQDRMASACRARLALAARRQAAGARRTPARRCAEVCAGVAEARLARRASAAPHVSAAEHTTQACITAPSACWGHHSHRTRRGGRTRAASNHAPHRWRPLGRRARARGVASLHTQSALLLQQSHSRANLRLQGITWGGKAGLSRGVANVQWVR